MYSLLLNHLKKYWLLHVIIFVVLLIPIGFYIHKFWNLPIGKKPSDWKDFADYLNGMVSPLIAFLTLTVTIIIAVILSKMDDKRLTEQREFEKRRIEEQRDFEKRKFLNDLRIEEYRRLLKFIRMKTDLEFLDKGTVEPLIVHIEQSFLELASFQQYSTLLFHNFPMEYIADLYTCYEKYLKTLLPVKNGINKDFNFEAMKTDLYSLYRQLVKVDTELQKYIIDQM